MQTDHETVREEALDALAALGNEHRIRILRALAEAETPLSFSELRRRVGIDDTGRFNYHLGELCGRFVRNGESGYELGTAGERVVLAAADLDPEAAAVTGQQAAAEGCPVCGERDCDRLVHIHLDGW
ncbi:MAG: hypothetical protein J07HX64_00293 [halophilic archaeon J07HX64]|jgi:hypothetical protein|nr:MAG: hypothetical protein J07HX64_00293 [halophilic archaeon J07HX64]